jgi:ferredoxin
VFANDRTDYTVVVPRTHRATAYCDDSGTSVYVERPLAFTLYHRGRRARTGHGTGRGRRRRAGRADFTSTPPEPGARRSLPHLAPPLPGTHEVRELRRLPEAVPDHGLPAIRRTTIPSVRHATGPARVDVEKCTGCGRCVAVCPVGAITLEDDVAVVNESVCTACGLCVTACPRDAITLRR